MNYDVYKENKLFLMNITLLQLAKTLDLTMEEARRYSENGNTFHSLYRIETTKTKAPSINKNIPEELQQEWDRVVQLFQKALT